MKNSNSKITESESKVGEILRQKQISSQDAKHLGDLLSLILTNYFSNLDRETGMKGWSVDGMIPNDFETTPKKVTLSGNIHWLTGGSKCRYYQADLAKNTEPLLYSIKLKSNKQKNILYIGKTHTGWILNAT